MNIKLVTFVAITLYSERLQAKISRSGLNFIFHANCKSSDCCFDTVNESSYFLCMQVCLTRDKGASVKSSYEHFQVTL